MKVSDIPFAPTKILVDIFERELIHTRLMEAKVGYPERLALPFGDYWIRDREGRLISVERKHNDLGDEWPTRLHKQLMKAKKGGADEIVLLIEGALSHDPITGRLQSGLKLRKVTYNQIWTTLLRWQYTLGLKVYQSPPGSLAVARSLESIQGLYRRTRGYH